jgi:transposase
MLSSLDRGLPLTSQVLNGKRADDGLYVPAYDQVVKTVGHSRFLAVGDSKMAAWDTRCHLAVQGSWYLCPYREPASRGDDTEQWIEEALKEPEQWQAVTQTDEKTGEIKTIAQLYHWSRPQKWAGPDGEEVTWDERVLVTRSLALQQGLLTRRERKAAKLYQALAKLRLPPSRGRKRYRTALELRQVVDQTLNQFGMTGLVNVTLTAEIHQDGGQRWLVADYQRHQAAWEAMVARLGWHIYLTNVPNLTMAHLLEIPLVGVKLG